MKSRRTCSGFSSPPKSRSRVVRDAQHKLVAAADIRAMPTSFLIDRSGKIRFVHAGFDRDKTRANTRRKSNNFSGSPNHDRHYLRR